MKLGASRGFLPLIKAAFSGGISALGKKLKDLGFSSVFLSRSNLPEQGFVAPKKIGEAFHWVLFARRHVMGKGNIRAESPVTWEKFQLDMKKYFSVNPSSGVEVWEDSYLIYSAGFKAGLERVAELIQHAPPAEHSAGARRLKTRKSERQA
jgi:hypothetical protein